MINFPTIKSKTLTPYIRVQTRKDPAGLLVQIGEIGMSNDKNFHKALYLEEDLLMTAESRKDYLKVIFKMFCDDVDRLFADCDKPDCPNCGGEEVKHL